MKFRTLLLKVKITFSHSQVFFREHNRLVDQFASANPDWDDEMYVITRKRSPISYMCYLFLRLFQTARKWVIAFMQKIATREYTAATLARPLDPYTGYNPAVDPSMDAFFTSVGMRYGHSEVSFLSFALLPHKPYNHYSYIQYAGKHCQRTHRFKL